MARYVSMTGDIDESGKIQFSASWNHGETKEHSSASAIVQEMLTAGEAATGTIALTNTGESMLYVRMILTGKPLPGHEKAAANGMKMTVKYLTLDGLHLNPAQLEQGTDFLVEVTITNTGHQGIYREVALSHLFPSGWEIHNARMDPAGQAGDVIYTSDEYNYQDIRDDRVYTYFDLRQGESKTFRTLLNASYLGKFYLPTVSVEAMYDATLNARIPGEWVQVVTPGAGE
jgi:uncharacterized protein YfaS (alpha-2-macroglobulin family)